MEWIAINERIPEGPGIIVAIMGGRWERESDEVKDALIVILRSESCSDEWRTMDCTCKYYLPSDNAGHYETITYWMPFDSFKFPDSMKIKF